jgi:hypothetical protein
VSEDIAGEVLERAFDADIIWEKTPSGSSTGTRCPVRSDRPCHRFDGDRHRSPRAPLFCPSQITEYRSIIVLTQASQIRPLAARRHRLFRGSFFPRFALGLDCAMARTTCARKAFRHLAAVMLLAIGTTLPARRCACAALRHGKWVEGLFGMKSFERHRRYAADCLKMAQSASNHGDKAQTSADGGSMAAARRAGGSEGGRAGRRGQPDREP